MKIVTNNKKIKSHLTLNGHLINLTIVKVVLKMNKVINMNKIAKHNIIDNIQDKIKNKNNNKSVKNKK